MVQQLVKRRMELALSQRAVAAHLGVTPPAVAAWESGYRRIPIDRLIGYGLLVGLRLGWDPPSPPPPEQEAAAALTTLANHLGIPVAVTS